MTAEERRELDGVNAEESERLRRLLLETLARPGVPKRGDLSARSCLR